ncbi:hypothetical protein COY90_02780 [Candidatus Roizmanbacteria bacterium CG_4_10_14_0_8_um_filter_39_9]|uniref:Transglycosylase SLT domain-containing protein n=1 Tax=Candidatus Roizmanbacteria bacterium CG_4_10_14_0_8_um_filter_39_9 TaxID=1974829 RepID=A0A2M7QCS8_9BACT|nr:MAG: hypothetical protein COY90_02780 [Candidatus Roizmanbacteria bacterium CG_4_10_14_0_8_um_filter_39_9]
MKINKLPTMVIRKSLSSSPKIVEKQFFKKLKFTLYLVLFAIMLAGATYLNIIKDQVFYLQNTPISISNNFKSEIILDQTAAIIVRDGSIPPNVAKKYSLWIYEAAAKYSVDPILLLSIMHTESRFNYKAVSPTGPIGLFQVASSYHKEKTSKAALFDPKVNIMVGAQIVQEYSKMSKNTIEMLLRYNGSLGEAPNYAIKVMKTKLKYDREILDAIAS